MRIQYSEGIILIGLMVDNVGLWPAKTFEWRRVTQDLRKGGSLEMLNCTILPFRKWIKKSCVLCRNFISIYKITRTLHGRLGTRILSSRAERISHSFASLTRERYFQHSKIKFVFPRGHVISSIYTCSMKKVPLFGQSLPLWAIMGSTLRDGPKT